MMKKIIVFCLFIWILLNLGLYGRKLLKNIIIEGKWDEISSVFSDDSYNILKDYFSDFKSIKIVYKEGNTLTYKVKFRNQGEIGLITFNFNEQTRHYSNIAIKNKIQPLYFVEKFKKYKVKNFSLKIGDAELHFASGHFLEAIPFSSLIIFEGRWRFKINPSDREEKLTLNRIYKKDFFSQSNKSGIFILSDRDFLKKLKSSGEVKNLGKEGRLLFNQYQNAYGIEIKQFNEYWYLPFPQNTNFAVFKKDKKSFYYYSFNKFLIPDTTLSESVQNLQILSYNSIKGMKLGFGEEPNVSRLNLNVYFNPRDHFISGTSTISYKNLTSIKTLKLAQGIKIAGNLNKESQGLNVFRKRNVYYLLGAESDRLSLYFRGHIRPKRENFELFKSYQDDYLRQNQNQEKVEIFYFLSKVDNFYPNPGDHFYETQITATVPNQLNCLATGHLVEKTEGEPSVYKFKSVNSKGISMATGRFSLIKTLDTQIPLKFYITHDLEIQRELDLEGIKEGFDFFIKKFGALDLPEINLLLRPGLEEGGISNNGFIVVNFFDRRHGSTSIAGTPSVERRQSGPILIRDKTEDYILHELAHQWWGGLVSWRTYQDNWITEGLAHFSVLYYLKKKLSAKHFNRIVKKLKRWVNRYHEAGPIIYGSRIRSLENRREPYQSVIYNKTALVLLMAMELIGEEEFNQRLEAVLKEYKYKSISSMQFIRCFCKKKKELSDFFKKWIYSRSLPVVELGLVKDHTSFDVKEFKKVVLSITQLNSNFIFPLKLKISTYNGSSFESLVVKEKRHEILISRDSTIRTIDIEDWITPVREKKNPNPYQISEQDQN